MEETYNGYRYQIRISDQRSNWNSYNIYLIRISDRGEQLEREITLIGLEYQTRGTGIFLRFEYLIKKASGRDIILIYYNF